MSKLITRKEAIALGLPNYFTGKPCQNGHVSERDVKEWRCLECRREKARRTHARYAEERNEKARESYANDPEYRAKRIAEARAYGKNNKQKVRGYHRDYYQRNKDHMTARSRAYWKAKMADPVEREKENARKRFAKKNVPELYRVYVRNRRAALRNAEGRHTRQDIDAILDAQGWICVHCPADLREHYHIDHIVPIARGGTNWPSNLQGLCPACNLSKSDHDEDEWLKERGP